MNLKDEFLDRIASGLKRKSITTCSKWAENYRVLKGKKWTFDEFPWTKELHDCDDEMVICQKAAQIGFTEYALNRNFFKIDIKNVDCLYVLPTESDASDFSSGRFDTALSESEHLQKLFSDVNNVSLKRAGNTTLYVRGSKSRSKLKSIPTGQITLDEVEEMAQENIPLAFHRASGQSEENFQILLISTPILPKRGINKWFLDSTQEHFHFKCPSCSKYITLKFPESLIITAEHINDPRIEDSHYICYECKNILHHETKRDWLKNGKYIPTFAGRQSRGFTCNQLYSMRIAGRPKTVATEYLNGIADPTAEQEFWNSVIGQPHIVADSKLTELDVEECRKSYPIRRKAKSPVVTIGIDPGALWHYEVAEWYMDPDADEKIINEIAIPKVLDVGALDVKHHGEKSVIDLIKKWSPSGVVIDRHPETVAAYNIAKRFWGIVYLCVFTRGVKAKRLQFGDENEKIVNTDRTSWMDMAFKRFRKRSIHLPADIPPDYIAHMVKPIRVYQRDADGNPVGRYVSEDDNDHYAFARVYNEMALPIAVKNKRPRNIGQAV